MTPQMGSSILLDLLSKMGVGTDLMPFTQTELQREQLSVDESFTLQFNERHPFHKLCQGRKEYWCGGTAEGEEKIQSKLTKIFFFGRNR